MVEPVLLRMPLTKRKHSEWSLCGAREGWTPHPPPCEKPHDVVRFHPPTHFRACFRHVMRPSRGSCLPFRHMLRVLQCPALARSSGGPTGHAIAVLSSPAPVACWKLHPWAQRRRRREPKLVLNSGAATDGGAHYSLAIISLGPAIAHQVPREPFRVLYSPALER